MVVVKMRMVVVMVLVLMVRVVVVVLLLLLLLMVRVSREGEEEDGDDIKDKYYYLPRLWKLQVWDTLRHTSSCHFKKVPFLTINSPLLSTVELNTSRLKETVGPAIAIIPYNTTNTHFINIFNNVRSTFILSFTFVLCRFNLLVIKMLVWRLWLSCYFKQTGKCRIAVIYYFLTTCYVRLVWNPRNIELTISSYLNVF